MECLHCLSHKLQELSHSQSSISLGVVKKNGILFRRSFEDEFNVGMFYEVLFCNTCGLLVITDLGNVCSGIKIIGRECEVFEKMRSVVC